jgi:hypothetical protein
MRFRKAETKDEADSAEVPEQTQPEEEIEF